MFHIIYHQANRNENETMRCHYKPTVMPKTWNMSTLNTGKDVEQKELSFIVSGNAKWDSYFGIQFSGLS